MEKLERQVERLKGKLLAALPPTGLEDRFVLEPGPPAFPAPLEDEMSAVDSAAHGHVPRASCRAGEGRKVRRLADLVPFVNELEPEMEALSDEDLRRRTDMFHERVDHGESLDDLLVEAFAVVREAATR